MLCLNETNYLTWHIHMHALLICSNLWGIISGTESTSDPSKASVTKINTYMSHWLKATAEIALYVNDSQIIHVIIHKSSGTRLLVSTMPMAFQSNLLLYIWKFSCMKKQPQQLITSWIDDVKTCAYLLKDINIKLSKLLTIIVLTSGLPSEYDSVVVALDTVKPYQLTLKLTTSHLLKYRTL